MLATVIPATWQHAVELAPQLRAGDLAECLAFGFGDAREALLESLFGCREAWTIRFDGQIAAMLGVSPALEGWTEIWCLTGRVVDSAKLTFMRCSRRMVAAISGRYPRIANLVDARYHGALDWLECLGFTVGEVILHPGTAAPCRLAQLNREA